MKEKTEFVVNTFIQLLFCVLVLSATSSCSKDISTKEISLKDQHLIAFQRLQNSNTAKFVLIPWLEIPAEVTSKLSRWDDSAFKEIGCTYSTHDPILIAKLIDALKRVNIEKGSNKLFRTADEAFAFSVRQGVYLNLLDGTEVKFLFEQVVDPVSKRVTGEYIEAPELKALPISANSSLSHVLAEWAIKTGKPVAKEGWMEKDCERVTGYHSLHIY